MEINPICLASALIGGLMLSRLTKLLHLPAVTGYLLAGLLLRIITRTALGFIAFTIGILQALGEIKPEGRTSARRHNTAKAHK